MRIVGTGIVCQSLPLTTQIACQSAADGIQILSFTFRPTEAKKAHLRFEIQNTRFEMRDFKIRNSRFIILIYQSNLGSENMYLSDIKLF